MLLWYKSKCYDHDIRDSEMLLCLIALCVNHIIQFNLKLFTSKCVCAHLSHPLKPERSRIKFIFHSILINEERSIGNENMWHEWERTTNTQQQKKGIWCWLLLSHLKYCLSPSLLIFFIIKLWKNTNSQHPPLHKKISNSNENKFGPKIQVLS